MSYPRQEPPEPKLDPDDQRELSRAYAQAEEVFAAVEDLIRQPAGFDLTRETNGVSAAIEELLHAIEGCASDYGLRL